MAKASDKKSAAAELTPAGAQQIRETVARFSRNLPAPGIQVYDTRPGDGVRDELIDAPPGRYRVAGSDWIVTVKDFAITLIQRATPAVWKAGGYTEIYDNNQAARPQALAVDTAVLEDQGWWPPQKAAEVQAAINALCRESPTRADATNSPNPKFGALLVMLAKTAELEVSAEALAEAQRLIAK